MNLDDIIANTPFAERLCHRYPDWLSEIKSNFDQAWSLDSVREFLLLPVSEDLGELKRQLRERKNRVVLEILLRDLAGNIGLDQVLQGISLVAEASLQQAWQYSKTLVEKKYAVPATYLDGEDEQQLTIIGMGKLGGGELNVSSDIDLIFAYPEEGLIAAPKPISHHEFFTEQARLIIAILGETTEDGYVFRVDTRLRPFGTSGALVCSYDTLEKYYVTHGRDWERYALIKALPICGNYHEALWEILTPFVYRKYLDYSSIDSLRDLKKQIKREVQRRHLDDNIKLGSGGIREIEFIAQAFQLIRGGRLRALRTRSTRQALRALAEHHILEPDTTQTLLNAYTYLRNLEHRLQYDQDAQTHMLPKQAEQRQRLIQRLGLSDWDEFIAQLNAVRQNVSQQFNELLEAKPSEEIPAKISQIWQEIDLEDGHEQALTPLGYEDSAACHKHLAQIKKSRIYRNLPQSSKQRFDRLASLFIINAVKTGHPDVALMRGFDLLERISARSVYLTLFIEHPDLIVDVISMLAVSPYIFKLLLAQPLLLDTLLDQRQLYAEINETQLSQELHNRLHDIEKHDQELQMDLLREFKQSYYFRLAAQELKNFLPITQISDALSLLARVILQFVLTLAWRQMHLNGDPRFIIVAYGKLGSLELSYSSDIDIVFLYDGEQENSQQIYMRLSQRITHWLTTFTTAGILYETDFRLRPDGSKGMLALPINAFKRYQQERAWVWEHQALTRARVVAGDKQLAEQFDQIRHDILCLPRDLDELRAELVKMRERIQKAKPNKPGSINVKHIHGGMIDIEFIVQFLILAYSHQYPDLAGNTGNIALLKHCAELGLIPMDLAISSGESYAAFRQYAHDQTLLDLQLDEEKYKSLQALSVAPKKLWQQIMLRTES